MLTADELRRDWTAGEGVVTYPPTPPGVPQWRAGAVISRMTRDEAMI